MKKRLNRLTSFLLAFIMVFTLFPLNVFANDNDGDLGSGTGGTSSGDRGTSSDGDIWTTGIEAMRFSLYFAEGSWTSYEDYEKDLKDPTVDVTFNRIGDSFDMLVKDGSGSITSSSKQYISYLDVAYRMESENGEDFKNLATNSKNDAFYLYDNYDAVPVSSLGFEGTFPAIFIDGKGDENRFLDFFMKSLAPHNDPNQEIYEAIRDNGSAKDKNGNTVTFESELRNTMAVINQILQGNESIRIDAESFVNGYYYKPEINYATGDYTMERVEGIFKLYFEPVSTIHDKDINVTGTTRDFIAYQNANSGRSYKLTLGTVYGPNNGFTTFYTNMGNTVWLTTDELQINMYKKAEVNKQFTSSEAKGTYSPKHTYFDSAGVGRIQGYPMNGKRIALPVNIVSYYVTINDKGEFEQIHDPDFGQVSEWDLFKVTYADGIPRQTNILNAKPIVKVEGDEAYLNDVITYAGHYDNWSKETTSIAWIENEVPVVDGSELEPLYMVKNKLEILIENPEHKNLDDIVQNADEKYNNDATSLDIGLLNKHTSAGSMLTDTSSGVAPDITTTSELIYSANKIGFSTRSFGGNPVVDVHDNNNELSPLEVQLGDISAFGAVPYEMDVKNVLHETITDLIYFNEYSKEGEDKNRVGVGHATFSTGEGDVFITAGYLHEQTDGTEPAFTGVYIDPKNKADTQHLWANFKSDSYWKSFQECLDLDKSNGDYADLPRANLSLESNMIFLPENTIFLRYIVAPKIKQYNVVHYIDPNIDVDVWIPGGEYDIEPEDLIEKPDGSFEYEIKPQTAFPDDEDVEQVGFGTSLEKNPEEFYEEGPDGIPPGGDIPYHPTKENPVQNYPTMENLYVVWEKKVPQEPVQVHGNYEVPEWRLSRYWETAHTESGDILNVQFGTEKATVNTASCDCGHIYFMSPSGQIWAFASFFEYVTPNGTHFTSEEAASNPSAMKTPLKWLHSRQVDLGNRGTIPFRSPRVHPYMNATVNVHGIKITEDSKLELASWLNENNPQMLADYDISENYKPKTWSVSYKKNESTNYTTKDIQIVTNYYYNCACKNIVTKYGVVHVHDCTMGTNILGDDPEKPSVNFDFAFHMYKPESTSAPYGLDENNKITIENENPALNYRTRTTMRYQLTDTLHIYPEVGMLMSYDSGKESDDNIKWVVGEQERPIQPIVWQTLEHKVFVDETPVGSSVATDTRAIATARSIGEQSKPVIYKGATVNTAFQIFRNEKKDNKGIMTAKTFVLDFNEEDYDVKDKWGNSGYKSQTQHDKLITTIKGTTIDATEKLLIDSPTFGDLDYTGDAKKQSLFKYQSMQYDGSDVVTFTHKLIVRGGYLIGVYFQDRNTNQYTLYTMAELKTKDEALYEALQEMRLFNEEYNKDNTVFNSFESDKGAKLVADGNGDRYATLMMSTRAKIDSLGGKSVSTAGTKAEIKFGEGWYDEDTVVLVVKEYVTNFEVPSTQFSDKISMSVNGLNTPLDKGAFFNTLGKGYTFLRYDLIIKPDAIYKGLGEIDSYFEANGFKANKDRANYVKYNNVPDVKYLVPNVSITDTTR